MLEKVAEHPIQIRQHVVVPVANYRDAFLRKPSRPTIIGIFALLCVLSAIHLDRETEARAIEVDGIWTDRMLFSEREAIELIAAQCPP